jgi:lysophospholipase L1-like esterase
VTSARGEADGSARTRSRLVPAAVVGAGLVTGLLLAEAIVRLLHAAPDVGFIDVGRYRLSANPRLGYEMIPRLACEGPMRDQFHFKSRSNALGFRDRDHATDKEPGTYRILVLGDSIAAGLRVDDDRLIFPALLEKGLRARGVPAEVMNFAVSGYNTLQEVETLKHKGLDYHPDLVLLAYCLNDRERVDGGLMRTLLERERGSGSRFVDAARVSPVLAKSALYRFLRYRVFATPSPVAEDDLLDRDTVPEELDELSYLARAHGFQVLVAVFPRFDALVPYPFGAEHAFIRRQARVHGFASVDLLPAFQKCALEGRENVAFDNLHPTVYGHACAAAAIEEAIAGLSSGSGAAAPATVAYGGASPDF